MTETSAGPTHTDHTDPEFMPPRLLNTGIALVAAGGLLLLTLCAIAACRARRLHVLSREQQRLALQSALAETSEGRV
jgi:hypothetical protein